MIIKSLKLNNFRNHEKINFEFDNNINIFHGNNANGKTNIIESLYFCSFGKSFRTRKDNELIMFDKEMASIELIYEKKDRNKKVNVNICNKNKKNIKINDLNIKKISELFGKLLIILFSPEDINLIKGDPGVRRKYFDLMIGQLKPSYIHYLQEYYKVIEQRNTLIKRNYGRNIEIELDIWDEKLSILNKKIYKERIEIIKKINPLFNNYVNEFSDNKENANIKYKTQISEDIDIIDKLKEKRVQDIERGFTSFGIHRDDYIFFINDELTQNFASQGQIKTTILSLKFAQKQILEEELNETPILLLDDVTSELDEERRAYILNKIDKNQIFITCTENLDIKKGKKFEIKK